MFCVFCVFCKRLLTNFFGDGDPGKMRFAIFFLARLFVLLPYHITTINEPSTSLWKATYDQSTISRRFISSASLVTRYVERYCIYLSEILKIYSPLLCAAFVRNLRLVLRSVNCAILQDIARLDSIGRGAVRL